MVQLFKRKRVRIAIFIISIFLVGRWLFHLAVEYTIKNYFEDQVTLSAETMVSYKLRNLQIFWIQSKIKLNDVSIHITQTENFKDTTNIKLTIPSFTLDLLSIQEVIFDKSLTIEQMILNDPEIHFFLPIKEDTLELQKEVGTLHQKTLKFLQQLKIKNFNTQNASVLWSIGSNDIPKYTLKKINVILDDIEIIPENISGEEITELLLSDHLEITLGDNSILLPDSKNLLNFKKLKISSKEKELLFDGLHLQDINHKDSEGENLLQNSLLIPSLHLKGIDFLTLYLSNYLLVDTIFVDETHLHFEVDENILSLFRSDQKSPKHNLDSIRIKHVQLIPSFLSVNHSSQTERNTLKVDSTAITLTNVNYKAGPDSINSWSLENLQLHLKDYQSKLEQAHYSVNFETLDWSFKDKIFVLEGIQIYPIKDSLSKTEEQIIEYLEIPAISIQNIDFEDLFVHQRLMGGRIKIDSPNIGVLLPKSPTNSPQKIPDISTEIRKLLEVFKLESVDLQQGNLALFKGETTPFLTLNNLNISGKDWKIADDISDQMNFDLEARVGNGILHTPEFKVDFKGVNFSSQKDFLNIQEIVLRPASLSKELKGQIRLKDVQLDGFLNYTSDNRINFLKIGNAKADMVLTGEPKKGGSIKEDKTSPIFIDQFSIGHLEASIVKPGTGTLVMNSLEADLKSIVIGGSDFPFSFDTENSKIKTEKSSVSYTSGKAQFDSLGFYQKNLFVYGSTLINNDQSEDKFNISIPLISLSGLMLPDSLNECIGAGRITLHDPKGDFYLPNKVDSKKEKTNPQNPDSKSLSFKLDTLQIANAGFVLKQESEEGESFWKSEETYLDFFDIRYPQDKSDYYLGGFELSLNRFVHQQKNLEFQIEQASLSSKNKSLTLINSKLEKSEFSDLVKGMYMTLDIPQIIIRTEKDFNINLDQEVNISEFLIDNPKLFIKGNVETAPIRAGNEKQKNNDFPISSLDLHKFGIKNMSIDLEIPQDNLNIWFEGFNFTYNDFYWNSKDTLNIEDLVALGDWTVGLENGKASISNPAKMVEISGLSISGPFSEISWNSVGFKTSDDPITYTRFLTHQETWMGIQTGYSRISGIDWREIQKSQVKAQKVLIGQPKLWAYRDQRLPFPENHFPPMLHKTLVNSSIPISIDTVQVKDGIVNVETQPPLGEKTASIAFSKVEATITNITNLPEEIVANNKMKMRAKALIQDTGQLTKDIDFSLDDPDYSFFMDVSLGKMDLSELNDLIEPLASVRIKSGKMRKMEIKALGNEDYAYGNMDFLYRKLSISILDKKDHNHQNLGHAIESFLANELVIKRNNDYPFPHRQGQLFFVRDSTRSIFNYFAKISLSGIMTSVGVKSNRKVLKQRHEEERKRLDSKVVNSSSGILE
ncbi:protein of unknown function [Aquiflexum balticum DSM 16537]|uniref:Uncharacterized protein n=1 Tax=Aquiflexum balticum DSM 16537 TaxID=758820 RepID=A0A1W2H216_9BACT|nr:DUF748 domain-containing protein [Aquiflexum balticum]SMD42804.1 protein of unknown function [Aquiflexum balticum DSM 16537]